MFTTLTWKKKYFMCECMCVFVCESVNIWALKWAKKGNNYTIRRAHKNLMTVGNRKTYAMPWLSSSLSCPEIRNKKKGERKTLVNDEFFISPAFEEHENYSPFFPHFSLFLRPLKVNFFKELWMRAVTGRSELFI